MIQALLYLGSAYFTYLAIYAWRSFHQVRKLRGQEWNTGYTLITAYCLLLSGFAIAFTAGAVL